MADIASRIDGAKRLLDKIGTYNKLVVSDNFEPTTIDDMKDNAKDICDAVKAEVDQIKAEIDQWS